MPSIYYVKKDGICANDDGRVDVSVKRTGLWDASTANYYDSIKDLIADATTDPVSGDFIYVSHLHDKDHGANSTIKGGDGVTIVSVDNANQENYLKGAKEGNASSGNVFLGAPNLGDSAYVYGMHFYAQSSLFLDNRGETYIYMEDCTLELTSTSVATSLDLRRYGATHIYKNCSFLFNASGQRLIIANAASLTIIGGTCGGGGIAKFLDLVGTGGAIISIDGLDASSMASSSDLINISLSNDDNCYARVSRVELPTGGVVCNATSLLPALNVIGNSLKVGSGGGHNHRREVFGAGVNTDDTGIYRTLGSAFKDGTNFSTDMTSNSVCSYYQPLRHKIASFFVNTGDFTSTIDFKIHFARDGSSVAYTDADLWFDAYMNDGADDGLGALLTSRIAPLVAGTNHTTETSLWTGLGTNIQMSETLQATIGVSAGNIRTGVVTLWANFAVPSDTVFIDERVALS